MIESESNVVINRAEVREARRESQTAQPQTHFDRVSLNKIQRLRDRRDWARIQGEMRTRVQPR